MAIQKMVKGKQHVLPGEFIALLLLSLRPHHPNENTLYQLWTHFKDLKWLPTHESTVGL